MTPQYAKLKALLQELFQLDQPDLDFGLYRVMHAKRDEVTQFLDKDLLPQVQAAFGQYQTADKTELAQQLAKAIEQAQALGADPETLPKVKELRARLATDAVDVKALEREVYDHLYSFFRRYYSEGDFLAKRVYKPGVYAIPYEGEEVTLHWANKDQYYIKTSEYLRDYAFRLRPDDEANPMRVHFRLVDAAEGEHGNVKTAEGKERRFRLAADQPIELDGGELVIRFTFLPDLRKQAELNAEAETAVLGSSDAAFAEWVAALKALAPSEKDATRTVLMKHLKGYSDRNTFDYFIHKDLGGFLQRELDFYIKNEVMHLDDVESDTAPRVEQYLSKIKVVRRIAGKIIDFLAQLENFQKKLWLKKKFVVETSYCIRLGIIPEEFYPEIAENEAQRKEWVKLCSIDEVEADLTTTGFTVPLECSFLREHPTLAIDSRFFDVRFVDRLVNTIHGDVIDVDGYCIRRENLQALHLIRARFEGRIPCIYIDPPYNTGGDGFAYKDAYQRSSWLSLIADRLDSGRQLQSLNGTCAVSIDDSELHRLSEVASAIYDTPELATLVWDRNRKNDAKYFSVGHEYMLVVAVNREALRTSNVVYREPQDGLEEARVVIARLRAIHSDDWKEIKKGWLEWFDSIPLADPRRRLRRYSNVGPRGPFRDDGNINWPGGDGPRYEVLHPLTRKACRVPVSGWRYSTVERFWEEYAAGRIVFGEDESKIPSTLSFLFESDGQVMPSVHFSYAQTASQEFDALFGYRAFENPKHWRDLRRVFRYLANKNDFILDYFAGSGSTAHAVINLNREDAGSRKFILVEMGDHFDSVLLPRIKKVTYTPEWKDGKPKRLATAEEAERSPRIVKVIRLESYEDALSNLEPRRTPQQQLALDAPDAQGADGLKEQYLLRYMLNVETRGSQSLLNVQAFTDPTAYKLKVKRPGSDESREVNVDLLETFNWLLGLRVQHIAAPQVLSASFVRDSERRLQLTDNRIREDATGPFWFRTVTGTTPDGRNTLVIWRKLTGTPEQDNLVLDAWFTKQGYSARDREFDLIYVNGGNNLENLKTADDRWKVQLIEEHFHRLMFEGTEG